MDMTSTEVLLGAVGASPLDTGEPIATSYLSTLFPTGEEGNGLLLLPLSWRSKRIIGKSAKYRLSK